ncbi:MAG: exodeoxyribonuclease VII small subunit [Propionibacteriaceae bacterium]|jgi:exodeoxyribonuclease VII small subunit|nr:exodeoxyribonuclease VII small subunit [Propionibacteriaceae bacterium]
MPAKPKPAAEDIGYEEAREQLAEIVHQLESGQVPLSQAMELWERGEQLAAICSQWLEGAKARIEAAKQSAAAD